MKNRQAAHRCEPGRVGPGAGRSASSAVERSPITASSKTALHALAAMLVQPRNTEKTSAVVEKPERTLQSERSRIPTRRRPLDTAAMGPKRSAAHRR